MPTQVRQLYERRHAPARETEHRVVDAPLLLIILMLLATGLIALFTASYPTAMDAKGDSLWFIKRQASFAGVGLIIMWFMAHINYRLLAAFQKPIFLASLALMAVTPFFGNEGGGAVRWIRLGPISFQPSEVLKFAVILSFSWYAARPETDIRKMKNLLPYGVALGVIAALFKQQDHMSGMAITFCIGFAILFVAGIRVWYLIPIGAATGVLGAWFVTHSEHIMPRIKVWIDPFSDIHDKGWQGAMSQIAIGTGGLFGRGLGQGRQKHLFLPEPQNDFVFANWCEELGLIGALLVLIMFAYLIFRGLYIARSSRDKFGCLFATGITIQLAVQTLLNLCVVTGITPVTGASLPFFSYGGTALLLQLFEMGILLNISKYIEPENTG